MQPLSKVVANPSGWDSLSNYIGQSDFPGWDCLLTQNRDSDCLKRSNFSSALCMLGGEGVNVQVHRFGHWACGWWEALAVRQGTLEHSKALEIEKDMEAYPVVDEEHWGNLEQNEAAEYWERLSVEDRIELCQKHGVSIFAARHRWIPETSSGELITE